MNKVAALSPRERNELFTATSGQFSLLPPAIEKDFWVCWVLKQIFENQVLASQLVFKGGTSLSKCFSLIERFSEDIDLILDWTVLTDENPNADRSLTQQDKFNKLMEIKAQVYIKEKLMPLLTELVAKHCTVGIHKERPRSIVLSYPKAFESTYIKSDIELEFGPMSALVPRGEYPVRPYCANVAPHLFQEPDIVVRTIEARKTFWDKITILHAEAHRPEDKQLPARYSRHYYDLHRMINSPTVEEALADLSLLKDIIHFKNKFFPQHWANYPEAKEGKFKLLPPAHRQKKLQEDYGQMHELIFGDYPSFEDIMQTIGRFEQRLLQEWNEKGI